MRQLPFRIACSLLLFLSSSNFLFSQTWEIHDLAGNLKSRAIYDRVEVLGENVLIGKNQEGLFLLSHDLKPMVSLKGTEIYQYLSPWIIVKSPEGLGAFHEYGQQTMDFKYDEIQIFFNILLGRKGKEYWLFQRGNGKTTPLGELDEARLTKNGVLIVKKGDSYYLPLSKDPERPFELIEENEGDYMLAKESTGYGILNIEGDYVMDPVVDKLEHNRGDYFYGFDENQYLLIKGDVLKSDVSYNSYHKITKEGDLMLEYIHGKLRRVMDESGILLDAVGMESVEMLEPLVYNVRFREKNIGLLGAKGWLVKPVADADWIKSGSEGLFPASKLGKSGYLNSAGEWTIPAQFDEVGLFSEGIASYRSSGNWGLINSQGQIIAPASWEEVKPFSAGMAIAKAGGDFFLIDNQGKAKNSEGFEKICRLKEGYFLVEKNGKRGLLDKAGVEILPVEFENISVEKTDFFIVQKAGLTGVLNTKGDVLFPVSYQEVVPDWTVNQILVKEMYVPVVIQQPVTNTKRKKGA